MSRFDLGRKWILDTMLAATYKCAGVALIVSTNFRDFAVFPGMHPVLVTDPGMHPVLVTDAPEE